MARNAAYEKANDPDIEVQRVAEPAQPARRAVAVGSVHDPAEADADRLADRALALTAEYGNERGERPTASAASGIHRSASGDVDGLSVDASALDRARSGGQQLDESSRAKLEHGFGTDLGGVRVHTGSGAADVASQIHARAFTHGSDVYFGKGEYRPGTPDGDRVLAHEVAHTVQSGSGGVHRYPATWSTSPVPWKPLTASVFRPGEGASGGVYIITSNDGQGPVKKAVVKPVFGHNALGVETGQQLQFSDAALGQLLGLTAPDSKVVYPGGSEFKDLVDLCQSKQPQSTNPNEPTPNLSDAESFVVMSEVPDASSIASMADKAPTDKRASADLFSAVFDHGFLSQLGRLCVGDLMLGNADRMVHGAMNLGNIMVSAQDGRTRVTAIDTTAALPPVVAPSDWIKTGGSAGGGFSNTKTATNDPGDLLDGFFDVLVSRLKRGTPDNAGPNPTWEVIERIYKNNRDFYFASFDFGWNDALITAMTLANDKNKVSGALADYDDPNLSESTLMANLSYLGSRAEYKSHDESVGRSIAITAGSWVKSLDQERMHPSGSDALSAKSMTTPSTKAIKAEVVAMPRLPTGANLKWFGPTGRRPLASREYTALPKLPQRITDAHAQVDQSVSTTKKRRKQPFGHKKEEPRNRSVVSHYVAHATAMGLGASRMADAAMQVGSVSKEASALVNADYRGNEATPVKALLTRLGTSVPVLATQITSYKRHLSSAETTVPQTQYGDRDNLSASLSKIDAYLDNAILELADVKKMNLQRAAANLATNPN